MNPVKLLSLVWAILLSSASLAQMPPMFFGGPPGFAQFQAISLQRHQARTLLYREALEELRKNPQAADVPPCPPGIRPKAGECLAPPVAPAVDLPTATPPVLAPAPTEARPDVAPAPALPPVAGRRLALLLGNNHYKTPIPPLETPHTDVGRIAMLLDARFGYRTHLLKDKGKTETIAAFNALAADARPEDSVLIFYAGHGYQMDGSGMGFWIPSDASVKSAQGWISNDDIARLLAAIPARQIILVSDSCFSGTLAKERKIKDAGKLDTDEVLRRRSVLVMTSGDEEPVSDEGKDGHSIFAWNLIRTLETAGGVTPGVEVWRSVHNGVRKEYPQEAQYGAVMSAGHVDGGDFIFSTAK